MFDSLSKDGVKVVVEIDNESIVKLSAGVIVAVIISAACVFMLKGVMTK